MIHNLPIEIFKYALELSLFYKKRGEIQIFNGTTLYKLGKSVLLDKIDHGENFLFLYENTTDHKQIFHNLMQQMADNNSILFYVSHRTNQLNFNFDVRNFSFNIINDDIIHDLKSQLNNCLGEMEKNNRNLFLISDWSNANLDNQEIFLPFLESLIKRSQGLILPGWKRRYRGTRQKAPFTLVNAFEVNNLKDDFIRKIIPLHQRIYLLQEKSNSFLLPSLSPSSGAFFPKYHVLPQQALEKIVKNNLEIIVLLFLEKNPQSGYQILKNIAKHFHCILSQGTLYPLLYQLEKEKKIVKQNGKGREVIYSLGKETKDNFQSRKETLLYTYQHLASFFEGQ